jgi:predicted metal-binding membrane protein
MHRSTTVLCVGVSGLVFAASAAATIYFCRSMAGRMEMPGGWTMSMMWMRMPGQTWWASTGMFLLMWLAMMVAMMLPSALPMLLNSRHAVRTEREGAPGGAMAMAAIGYFLVWMTIGGVVYVAGVGFAFATMQWPTFSRAVPLLSGAALILAGCFQFTGWKMAGLRHCRGPLTCAREHIRSQQSSAWHYGLSQGAACAVCCSSSMLALLALGAMNLTVMILVAAVIAMEKLAPKPELIARSAGLAALATGAMMITRFLP